VLARRPRPERKLLLDVAPKLRRAGTEQMRAHRIVRSAEIRDQPRRRDAQHREKAIHLVWRLRNNPPLSFYDSLRIVQVPVQRARANGIDRVRLKQERGHDTEVAPATAHAPEEVVVLGGAGG